MGDIKITEEELAESLEIAEAISAALFNRIFSNILLKKCKSGKLHILSRYILGYLESASISQILEHATRVHQKNKIPKRTKIKTKEEITDE